MSYPGCRVGWTVLFSGALALSAAAQDVTALKEQGRALLKAGNYAQAIPIYERAVAAASRTHGAKDQKTDILVNELAMAYFNQGRLAEAAANYQRVLQNTEVRNGPQHTEVATCLGNLAAVYDDWGDYDQALALHLRAYQIRVKLLGPQHPDLATNMNNLGAVYHNLRDDVRALEFYRFALHLYQNSTPRHDRLIANTLHNLAGAHAALGQHAEAEKRYREALAIREAKLGSQHPSVATTLNSLASTLANRKEFAEAEKLYQRGLQLREQRLGADHPNVAASLNDLGSFYSNLRRYESAEKLYLRALAIREKQLDPNHPSIAISLNNLAIIYQQLNRDEQAAELFARSLKINLAAYGEQHPQVALAYKNSALLRAKQKHWADAAAEIDRSRRIVRRHASEILPALTETQQLAFLKFTAEESLHIALSLGLSQKDDLAIVEKSAEWLLNAKGVAQQALAQKEMRNRDLRDPQLGPLVKQLQEIRRELAYLQKSRSSAEAEARRARAGELRKHEAALAGKIAALTGRPTREGAWVTLAEVRQNLRPGDALVEFARFRVRDFALRTPEGGRWLPARYAAWIIPAAEDKPVRLIDLGPAAALEDAVSKARQALTKSPQVIQEVGDVEAEKQLLPALKSLSQVALAPLLPEIGSANRWLLSPDAALWLVPWGALPLADQTYAIETHELVYLLSGRDLLDRPSQRHLNPPLIFADPEYGLGLNESLDAVRTLFGKSPPAASKTRPAAAIGGAQRLPGTAAEAKLIAPSLEDYAEATPTSYLGRYALEGVLRSASQPKAVVICTHGFFLEDAPQSGGEEEGAAESDLQNPLLRCGLLFAGCNTRELAGRVDADDGVLTGLEIAGIDLRGTQLVVLSACETGLGEVRNGEGVAGLRHAFQLAGAKSVVATLWEIPDATTARLMNDFFSGLAEGKTRSQSLRASQQSLINSRRDERGAAHPFFWAAFTLTGAPE